MRLTHGFEDIQSINKTIQYEIYEIKFKSGNSIRVADNHIFFDADLNEIYAKDSLDKILAVKGGFDKVVSVNATGKFDNMYDLTVNSKNHRYYTNGILSHNTTTAAGYLLWYACFNEDKTVLIASNKNSNATEIMDRIKFAYEELPSWIKPRMRYI